MFNITNTHHFTAEMASVLLFSHHHDMYDMKKFKFSFKCWSENFLIAKCCFSKHTHTHIPQSAVMRFMKREE